MFLLSSLLCALVAGIPISVSHDGIVLETLVDNQFVAKNETSIESSCLYYNPFGELIVTISAPFSVKFLVPNTFTLRFIALANELRL